ncbi:MAG TPA: plasmid replication protein, CyRepA1 family, partial [Thermosynechococcaceae cyanobacterium]
MNHSLIKLNRQKSVPSSPRSSLIPTSTPVDFEARIKQEFIVGSAIVPDLYCVATQFVGDTDVLPGGEVSYPIHEALNWKLTRFGYHARATQQAALLVNEDGSTWQAKLSNPRTDRTKGTAQKYETPVGSDRAYLPPVPPSIRQAITQRYGVEVPLIGSFWNWLEQHPEIPVVFTEGGKKALCLLSLGYVAIALYGINGGYRVRDQDKNIVAPYLLAEVSRFSVLGRATTLAFDQDTKLETRTTVARALARFGGLLTAAGCEVTIAQWQPEQGKGVDDLCVQSGGNAVHGAIANALPLPYWQIWQRLNQRLTYPANLKLTTADLSNLKLELPEEGILAIASAKGTGKTKQIRSVAAAAPKVLAAGHRIALMRNLCDRLNLDYRGDLDKAKGQFINGSGYTLRIGFCVDSLLAINPDQFAGCDLIIDEVVQVIRHLLTSSTCSKDGRRPALLSRLHQLIQVARRVIVADADLDNATLHYLKTLKGDDTPIYLIHNRYQPPGYKVRMLDTPDRTAITRKLMTEATELEPGKTILVATDSRGSTKTIARLLAKEQPEKRVLVINSETSGDDCEQSFIQTPDVVLNLNEYDIILCSPSMATGVSIELQDKIEAVYGIFTGASSTDADMAQALGRVRQPVDRVVWCAERGRNFSQGSRSTNALELKTHLQDRTSAIVSLVRSNLREDIADGLDAYDWQSNPHLNLYCQMAAAQNYAMFHLRDALVVRLRHEGNTVEMESVESDAVIRMQLREAREENKQAEAQAIVDASALTFSEVALLQQKENLTLEQQRSLQRYFMQEFYGLEDLTLEDVLWDNEGRRRGELLNLEALLFSGLAIDWTVKALEKQAIWNQGVTPWDISGAELRRKLREMLGFPELLEQMRAGWEWTARDLQPYADRGRSLAGQIQAIL